MSNQVRVLVYSHNADTRASVMMALGSRASADTPEIAWIECATAPALVSEVKAGHADVLILDGEATPSGGMGLCKELKDEEYDELPIMVLTARVQDAWLATWSRADAVQAAPIDPMALANEVARLIRMALGQPATSA